MPQPNVLILRAPGTNCDQETAFAFETAGATTETLHVNRLLESPAVLDRFQILCIPGGFSFGDDVAAGQILAVQMRHHLAGRLADFKAAGKLILGICNGFQVIIKSGILLDDDPSPASPPAAQVPGPAARHADLQRLRQVRRSLGPPGAWPARSAFSCAASNGCTCPWPMAKASSSPATPPRLPAWKRPVSWPCGMPLAPCSGRGGEGSAVGAQYSVLSTQYSAATDLDSSPAAHLPFPDNPNGSMADVAGVCDTTGRVLGLMPHPERHLDPTHHPRWTRGEAGPVGDGLQVFINAVRYFE